MNGAAPAFVAGVHRREEIHNLGAAHLAHDDPVRSHAQCLAHEVAQRHLTSALEVGRARLEAHDVRMARPELGRVFDEQDALRWVDELQECR